MTLVAGDTAQPGRRPGSDAIARTLAAVTDALERGIFGEQYARPPGLLQAAAAPAKVLSAAVLLVAIGLSQHVPTLLAVHAATVVLAKVSRLPVGHFLRRTWLGVPLFAGFIVAPSVFLVPGAPVLALPLPPPASLAVTDNGLASAGLLVMRVGASISVALLLVSTTPWSDLLQGLRRLGVPDSFVAVLGMTHRYVFLFLRATNNLFLARASRLVGRTPGAEQRRWAGAAAGVLVSRSVKTSGEVLLAMRARGYDGDLRHRPGVALRDADRLLVALAVALSGAVLLLERGLM